MVHIDPTRPFNDLPLLPPDRSLYETPALLKLEARARAAVSELKGYARVIPNQEILINAVVLREARDSSEIENIVTTQDQLYRAALPNRSIPPQRRCFDTERRCGTGSAGLNAEGS